MLSIENCQVTQVKTEEKHGYNALQVGVGLAKRNRVNKPQRVYFEKYDLPLKRHLGEFRVDADALLPIGTEITAQHFKPGQYVDVQAKSSGKGFQGAMKRWGFKGQGASHGASRSHRSLGSTGQCQDPGRVFKGKKMAGQMGNKTVTVQNLLLYAIDPKRNLLFVKGAIPGRKGTIVRVKDAIKRPAWDDPLPYPTFQLSNEEDSQLQEPLFGLAGLIRAPKGDRNPLEGFN